MEKESVPIDGIQLCYLKILIKELGGEQVLENLSSADVCERFVKPKTSTSYCEMLSLGADTRRYVGKPDVFISHPWHGCFLDLVDSLLDHLDDQLYAWLDIFTINQHQILPEGEEFEWWIGSLKRSIQNFKKTYIVSIPWNNPIPFRRSWCLYEIYCSAICKNNIELIISKKLENEFLNATLIHGTDILDDTLTMIDAKNSLCTRPDDQRKIFSIIEKTISFEEVNRIVFNEMRKWYISILNKWINNFLQEKEDEDKEEEREIKRENRLKLQNVLTVIYMHVGYPREAEELALNTIAESEEYLGKEHLVTVTIRNNYGYICMNKKDFTTAGIHYQFCYEQRMRQLGLNHVDTLITIHNLAGYYRAIHDFDQAEHWYKICLDQRKALLGEYHAHTLRTLEVIGLLAETQKKYDKAIEYYTYSYDNMCKYLGIEHRYTMSALFNSGRVYLLLGDKEKAKECFHLSWIRRRQKLGDDHNDTKQAYENYMKCSE